MEQFTTGAIFLISGLGLGLGAVWGFLGRGKAFIGGCLVAFALIGVGITILEAAMKLQ